MKWVLQAILVILGFVLPASFARSADTDRPQRPNIIFILTDDQRWDSLGCAGNKIIQTPNIDGLAANGTMFRNCFVTTSICCCSRATFLSGQYNLRHGISDFSKPFSAEAWKQTYPALLRQNGYRTGFIGKFGVGKNLTPMEKEFDYWKGLPAQAGMFFEKGDPRHKTARFGDEALEFLKDCSPEKPFCLSISFNAPHARDGQPREFAPDPRDEKLYEDVTIPVPKTATDEFHKKLPEHARDLEGRKRWKLRFTTPEAFQKTTKDYFRLITGIDREVGRIRDVLAERKLADNTVIIYTSDNGFFLGERGMADKWLMYEESIRLPLVVYDPRLAKESRGKPVDAMVLNIDVAPTMVDLARLPIPERMQGKSLVPFLGGQPREWRSEFFYEHHFSEKIIPPSEGVRTEKWKYIRWTKSDPVIEELYDLKADPLEEKDLSKEPEHRKTLEELRARWAALREQAK